MSKPTFIIAEAGVNHNGSVELAKRLVDVAAASKADAVKFQTFKAKNIATSVASMAAYQTRNLGKHGDQLSMLQSLELSPEEHVILKKYCMARGIKFMSTAFDSESLAFISTLDMPAIKIPSGDITCSPLVLQASRLRKPLILSTGMSTLAEIEEALGVIAFGLTSDREPTGRLDFISAYCSSEGRKALQQYVTLLHCVTQYPTPSAEVNLRAMDTMRRAFGLPVGYSDHTMGIEISLAAVARGATIIEKHFTLDRALPGPDQAASLEPNELVQLVKGIRNVEAALGSEIKIPSNCETDTKVASRRSLVANCEIREGDMLVSEMLTWKRPGTGISPIHFWDMLGRKSTRDYLPDEFIE